jgi:hypothetical protein
MPADQIADPAKKWPSPTRRRNFRARGHGRDRNIHLYTTNSLPAVGNTNSSSRASRKVEIPPALQDSVETSQGWEHLRLACEASFLGSTRVHRRDVIPLGCGAEALARRDENQRDPILVAIASFV